MKPTITLREFSVENDSLNELTTLLHRSYGSLAQMGLRFLATYQDEATTLERISEGECYVALVEDRLVGTVVFRSAAKTSGSPWFDRQDVSSFGQFAVEPEFQGGGIGSALLDLVEQRARDTGAKEIALDTAEPAEHLIQMYASKGYRFIEHVQWGVTNYRSVVMSKALGSEFTLRKDIS